MCDRRVEEYKIIHANNRQDLVELVNELVRMGFNDPYIGRWEPQGGPYIDDHVYGSVQYNQAMVRTKKVLM